jgi:hypothetical protein
MELKYVGTSDDHTIRTKDFASIGVDDHEEVVWSRKNNYIAEVSDEAAEWLLKNMKSDFKAATEAEVAEIEVPDDVNVKTTSGKQTGKK